MKSVRQIKSGLRLLHTSVTVHKYQLPQNAHHNVPASFCIGHLPTVVTEIETFILNCGGGKNLNRTEATKINGPIFSFQPFKGTITHKFQINGCDNFKTIYL